MIKENTKAVIILNNRPEGKNGTWFQENENVLGKVVTVKRLLDMWNGKYPRYEISFDDRSIDGWNNRACLEQHLLLINSEMTLNNYIEKRCDMCKTT
jgi:hypothetical protein